MGKGVGVRGTLIYSYIRRLGPFLGVQNFEFQYLWVIRKMIFFFLGRGMKFFWIFSLGRGSLKNWTTFEGHFYVFWGSFLKLKEQNVNIFLVVRFKLFFRWV